jgi:hypothetical protein
MLALYEVKGVVPPQSADSNREFPNLTPLDDSCFFTDFRRRAHKWLQENHGGDYGPSRFCLQLFWFFTAVWAVSL